MREKLKIEMTSRADESTAISIDVKETKESDKETDKLEIRIDDNPLSKNAPPNYEKASSKKEPTSSSTIYKSIEYAKQTTKGSWVVLKSLAACFVCSLSITIILLVLMAIPVIMIIIGSMYLKSCPIQKLIPIWLIVFGALSIVKNLSTLIQRAKEIKKSEGSSSSTILNVFDSFMSLFLVIWFVCGNIWIYSNTNKVQYTDPLSESSYCHRLPFLFTFWAITSIYIIIGLCCLLFCFTICFTIFIPTKK